MPIKKKLSGIYLLTVLFLFLLTAISSYAQNKMPEEEQMLDRMKSGVKTKMTISGIKTEAKGDHETYIIAHQGNYLFVYNKNNTLMHTYSSFGENRDRSNQALKISIDKPLLDSYVKKILSPHFRGNAGNFRDLEDVMVGLYSDIEGNIKEISIAYPKEVNIPFSTIETFEKTLLNGDLKLAFDKSLWVYKDATWVVMTYTYLANKVGKM